MTDPRIAAVMNQANNDATAFGGLKVYSADDMVASPTPITGYGYNALVPSEDFRRSAEDTNNGSTQNSGNVAPILQGERVAEDLQELLAIEADGYMKLLKLVGRTGSARQLDFLITAKQDYIRAVALLGSKE